MNVIDRTKRPEYQALHEISLIKAEGYVLDNGARVYWINSGTQDVLKVEFLFSAGSRFQSKPLIASTVNSTIAEATKNYTGRQIAENMDFYGAFFQTESDYDFASVTMFKLAKHTERLLPYLKEVLTQATFPEQEISIHLHNTKQRFQVNLQKVNFLARKYFLQAIFGNRHPYGFFIQMDAFNNVKRDDITDFYNKFYQADNCSIILSGKITDRVHSLIEKYFSNEWPTGIPVSYSPADTESSLQKKYFVEKPDALQSAIRIGRPLFNKTHTDYMGMQVLNTVLGGYFGSRLMANIREEKGYTYGINSGITSLKEGGYFFIATEVGADVCKSAVHEIYHELKRLREEPVSPNELQLVKNYLMGVFLRSIDGPFALAERFKAILEYNLEYHYYDHMLDTIKNITPEQLQELAQKYFQEEDMYEVVVGKAS